MQLNYFKTKFTMKRIFIPELAAAALLASCSEWTEAENKDFLPQIKQDDPTYLASLRDFKAGEHKVTMMHIKGSASAPNRQNQHLTAMPDSVDFFLMSETDDLHPTYVSEIAGVRADKGTRTLNIVDYTAIRTAWETMRDAAVDTEHEGDYAEEKFAAYCTAETEKQLAVCDRYGFDGLVVSYLSSAVSTPAVPFVEAVEAWRKAHPEKLLFFRGYPAYLARLENQTFIAGCDYVIILTETASASVPISRKVREQLAEGVPSERIVLEASVPALADGGADAQVGATVQVAAQWVMDPKTATTVKCEKLGLAVSNAQEDYFNTPTYSRIREALAILNPEPENDSENENDDEK